MLHRLCKNLGSAWGKNNPSVAISQLLPWGICRESTDLGRKEAAKYVLWGPHGVALRHFLRNEVPAAGLVPIMPEKGREMRSGGNLLVTLAWGAIQPCRLYP